MNPGAHHLTNVFFHIFNTLLLFLVFRRMTRKILQSGLVAVLFALHPLHVESVAWIAERKDVLSTFFWMLTMFSCARYAAHPGINRYLPVVGFIILGLMAKPMLVTLPFVLLLM
jgi:dolichyl-phosphate-mannose--protein O-mannosyl transferase